MYVLHHPALIIVTLIFPPELWHYNIPRLVPASVGLLLLLALSPFWVGFQEDVKKGGGHGIGLRRAHRGATRRACVRMYRGRRRSLKSEPFFQARAAKGMQAVEECERLVEEIGTDLKPP